MTSFKSIASLVPSLYFNIATLFVLSISSTTPSFLALKQKSSEIIHAKVLFAPEPNNCLFITATGIVCFVWETCIAIRGESAWAAVNGEHISPIDNKSAAVIFLLSLSLIKPLTSLISGL